MSEYHSFALSQHLSNSKSSNDNNDDRPPEEFYQHKFSINDALINQNNKPNNNHQQHDWSHTTIDSILNSAPNFQTTPPNSSDNNTNFNPLFDFLPSFDDHLIIANPNTNNTNNTNTLNTIHTTEVIDNTTFNNNNNIQEQPLFTFDNHNNPTTQNIDEMRSITPYFDGIEEPQNYIIKDTTNTTNEIMLTHPSGEEMNNATGFLEFQSPPTSRINAPASSRTIQVTANAVKMKPAIQAYLHADDPIEAGERTVIIMTSKVAQKSYGTEKRFLCPPPTAILVGSSWWTPPSDQESAQEGTSFQDKDNITRAPPSLSIGISSEASAQQSGRIEWYCSSDTLVGQTGGSNTKLSIQSPGTKHKDTTIVSISNENKSASDDWYRSSKNKALAGGRCVLKRLYINDADEKRKKVECLIKVQLANGLMLGTLSSRGIKVISKPSKKRQSVKNIELCIYHGTTVSLFNRIRSQTVSTKYLGVSSTSGESSIFDYPGRLQNQKNVPNNSDTCFVARTSSWDPFVIWAIDATQNISPQENNSSCRIDEYIGCPSLTPTISYPNPPTIALKNRTNQPLAIRYNQHVVLQCLTTGLVSPVMIVRKVDKASTVVGGARCPDQFDPSFSGGGEYGDEVLGDPVSQLHKIALQIVQQEQIISQTKTADNYSRLHNPQPHTSVFQFASNRMQQESASNNMMPMMTEGPVTYLACLNDLVGTHKTTDKRSPIKGIYSNINPAAAAAAAESYNFTASALSATLNTMPSPTRKRRLSMLEEQTNFDILSSQQMPLYDQNIPENETPRRRVSSVNDAQNRFQSSPSISHPHLFTQRSHSISSPSAAYNSIKPVNTAAINRRNSVTANSGQALAEFGAYWSEDVTDAAVWTIVGTECARYTFWIPPYLDENKTQEKQMTTPLSTPFPCLTHFAISNDHYSAPSNKTNGKPDYNLSTMMTVSGENFTRDLQIWFGDIKAPFTEYRSREMLVCRIPDRDDLLQSVGLNRAHDTVSDHEEDDSFRQRLPFSIRILLVRGDGVVYKTSRSYSFC